MAAQAGWYPDPEGNTNRLRYWDGNQWTNDYTPVPSTNYSEAQAPQNTSQPPLTPKPSTMVNPDYQMFDAEQIYPMTSQDRTLRLIAFVLNVISTICCGWLIFTLAWMIPMTVHSWNIYKGKCANTVAFGVCTILFLDLISGILLLCSHKD